jgi:hypothetical protein
MVNDGETHKPSQRNVAVVRAEQEDVTDHCDDVVGEPLIEDNNNDAISMHDDGDNDDDNSYGDGGGDDDHEDGWRWQKATSSPIGSRDLVVGVV